MMRLKNAFVGERAAVIFGGPSLVEQHFDLQALTRKGYIIFVEAKALTPWLIESGVEPHFYLLPFAGKAKDNALQSFVFRAFLAGTSINLLLKPRWRGVAEELKANFDRYYEPWQAHRGIHKRFHLRPDVYLPDSPWDLLGRLPNLKILAQGRYLRRDFPGFRAGERVHLFETLPPEGEFSHQRYYDVTEVDGVPRIRQFTGQLNSAAIAVYPLLHYMGFREIFCLGMDMSMLGSMEFAAPSTFRSMLAFRWFFYRTRRAFNDNYKPNRPYYYRPASEFHDLRRLVSSPEPRIVRVHSPTRFAADVPDIPTMSVEEFLSR